MKDPVSVAWAPIGVVSQCSTSLREARGACHRGNYLCADSGITTQDALQQARKAGLITVGRRVLSVLGTSDTQGLTETGFDGGSRRPNTGGDAC